MQRGRRLFETLTEENQILSTKKGRNEHFIIKRNECLIYRYYYYAKVKQLKYTDVIGKLSEEFYLSERTISDIAQAQTELVNQVFREKPSLKTLIKKYNFLNWTNKN